MDLQFRTATMLGLILVAMLSIFFGSSPARAAGDDEIIFAPIRDPLGAGVIRFRGVQHPDDGDPGRPTIRVLVVYIPGAARPPAGVAYFRVDQSIDCSTHTVSSANYIAWDADGRKVQSSKTVPTAASDQVPPDLLGGYWDNECPSLQPPGIMPGPTNHGGLAAAAGIANAVARARERQALIVRAEHLATHGRFYEMIHLPEPFDSTILIDGDSVSKDGSRLRLSEVWINAGSAKPGSYSRRALIINCDTQTYQDEFKASYEPNGTLIDVAGEMPLMNHFDANVSYDQPLAAACRAFPPTSTTPIYPTIAAARAAALGRPMTGH